MDQSLIWSKSPSKSDTWQLIGWITVKFSCEHDWSIEWKRWKSNWIPKKAGPYRRSEEPITCSRNEGLLFLEYKFWVLPTWESQVSQLIILAILRLIDPHAGANGNKARYLKVYFSFRFFHSPYRQIRRYPVGNTETVVRGQDTMNIRSISNTN